MSNFFKNYLKKRFFFLFIIIFTLFFFNFFLNFFLIYKNNYQSRLIKNYGYCEIAGYGFIKSIIDKYNIDKNISIRNFNDFASIESLFHKINSSTSENFIIIIGADKKKINELKYKYQIIENFNNCYFLKKYD
jgi:dolichyl-phosphate-mannose--protein O-mannosyl transferase